MATYTGTDLEGDLARAALAKWQSLAMRLSEGIPGGLAQEPLPATPAIPYATLEVTPAAKEDEHSTGEQIIAYRTVAFKIRAVDKATAMRLGGQVNALFHSGLTFDGLMRFDPEKGAIETPKDEKYNGEQIHVATVKFTAWVHWDRSSHSSD